MKNNPPTPLELGVSESTVHTVPPNSPNSILHDSTYTITTRRPAQQRHPKIPRFSDSLDSQSVWRKKDSLMWISSAVLDSSKSVFNALCIHTIPYHTIPYHMGLFYAFMLPSLPSMPNAPKTQPCAPEALKTLSNVPKTFQALQNAPNRSQTPPNRLKTFPNTPKRPRNTPKRPQTLPKCSHNIPKRSPTLP